MSAITKRLVLLLAMLFAGVLYAGPASAQATRTWVSGVGDDVNPCSRTAPCKTFAGAISKTAAGGEINCIDPGGYGTVTIIKSITIDCNGVEASILSSATTGVIINGADVNVILRNIEINGAPPTAAGVNGVRFLQGASLLIENVRIFGFGAADPNGYAVVVNPATGPASPPMKLTVLNSTLSNNRAGGILVAPALPNATDVSLTVTNSNFENNGGTAIGLSTGGTTSNLKGKIVNSVISSTVAGGVGTTGIVAKAATGTASLTVINSTISDATLNGINSNGAGAVVRVTGSSLLNNTKGVNATGGGQIVSYGDNTLAGNGTDGSFTSTVPHS